MKHVIVTGGSRGLGLRLVQGLLEAGYQVSTCSRKETPEIRALVDAQPERLLWRPCNVGEAAEVDGFVKEAVAWAGDNPLYGLVNNAGMAMSGVLATFPNVDSERIIQVNLVGAMQMARAALRTMLRRKTAGRIINISSIVGSRGYNGLAAYSASKAGLDGFTRALSREVGRTGITVNSIAPGYLETEMSAVLNDAQRAQIVNRTPLGRMGTADDVLPAVLFLLSEGAGFITGTTLLIDGGISA